MTIILRLLDGDSSWGIGVSGDESFGEAVNWKFKSGPKNLNMSV